MGAKDVLSRKTGVIVGDDVYALFKHAQKEGCTYTQADPYTTELC